jgi:hypothetical protein
MPAKAGIQKSLKFLIPARGNETYEAFSAAS